MSVRFDHTSSMTGKLEHVRYDTFRTRWTNRNTEDAYMTFALNPGGVDGENDAAGDLTVGGL